VKGNMPDHFLNRKKSLASPLGEVPDNGSNPAAAAAAAAVGKRRALGFRQIR